MENKKNNKTKIIIQSIICAISGIMLLVCMYYVGKNFHNAIIFRIQSSNNISVFCSNDDELLITFNTEGIYGTRHEFCPTCGEKVEDVGLVSSGKCLNCNIRVDSKYKYCSSCGQEVKQIPLKDWLKREGFSTFKEYGDYYDNAMWDELKPIWGMFACALLLVLIIYSGDISRKISKKINKKKE